MRIYFKDQQQEFHTLVMDASVDEVVKSVDQQDELKKMIKKETGLKAYGVVLALVGGYELDTYLQQVNG